MVHFILDKIKTKQICKFNLLNKPVDIFDFFKNAVLKFYEYDVENKPTF